MKFQGKEIHLKNGKRCVLRSPEGKDAGAMLMHTKRTAGETHFLARYEEEITTTTAQQRQMIKDMCEDEGRMLLSAFIDGIPVATIGINRVSPHIKMCHRATFGLFVEQACWSMGLGTILIEEAIRIIKQMGYEQIEIGVYSDNERARALYKKMGFEEWGSMRRAYRLKDGTYIDEIRMGMFL